MAIAGRARCDLAVWPAQGCSPSPILRFTEQRCCCKEIMGSDRSFESICGCSQSPLFAIEGVAQGSQCDDDRGLRAQDQAAERGLHIPVTIRPLEFPIRPSTLPPTR